MGQKKLNGKLTVTISTPWADNFFAESLVMSRVIPLILYSWDRAGSAKIYLMTEPPWLPVAPKTVMIFDMICENGKANSKTYLVSIDVD